MKARTIMPLLKAIGPLAGLVFAWGLFAFLAGSDFTSLGNARLMLLQAAVVGTAAVGATIIIITGGIDLSVGSTIALGTVITALLLQAGFSPAVAAIGAIGIALVVGVVIAGLVVGQAGKIAALAIAALFASAIGQSAGLTAGLITFLAGGVFLWRMASAWVPRLELVPFVVTLALWGTLRGLAKGIADNQGVYPENTGWLGDLMVPGDTTLAPGVWILFLVAAAFAALLRWTPLGRHFFAVGSNQEAARLCGIRVNKVKLLAYVLGVGCAGIAALLQFSFLSMGDPTTAEGYELRVIAAVVIGGASLSGGEGSILGTLIGALIMVIVDNGCTKMGLENWVQDVVTGGIILAAVLVDRARHLKT